MEVIRGNPIKPALEKAPPKLSIGRLRNNSAETAIDSNRIKKPHRNDAPRAAAFSAVRSVKKD